MKLPPDEKTGERTYKDWLKADALKEVKSFATILGPAKAYLVDQNGSANDLIANAHKAGLKVIPYTFRNEAMFVQKPFKDAQEEYQKFFAIGIDGLFSDYPDSAILARSKFLENSHEKKK